MALVTDAVAAPPNVTNSIQSCECRCPAPELGPAPSPAPAACYPRYHAHHGKSQAERSQSGKMGKKNIAQRFQMQSDAPFVFTQQKKKNQSRALVQFMCKKSFLLVCICGINSQVNCFHPLLSPSNSVNTAD